LKCVSKHFNAGTSTDFYALEKDFRMKLDLRKKAVFMHEIQKLRMPMSRHGLIRQVQPLVESSNVHLVLLPLM
jgi:hypothetical protein